MNFPPDVRRALTAWTRAKESLRKSFTPADFSAIIRPIYLLGVLSENFVLLSIPPSRPVIERLHLLRPVLHQAIAAQGYGLAGLTAYPSDDELVQMSTHPSFAAFARFALRTRLERAVLKRQMQNFGDSALIDAALKAEFAKGGR